MPLATATATATAAAAATVAMAPSTVVTAVVGMLEGICLLVAAQGVRRTEVPGAVASPSVP